MTKENLWPKLDFDEWKETADTVHLFTQIIGKIRLALKQKEAQWAQVPFALDARGLSSLFMQTENGILDIMFDFLSHEIIFRISDGKKINFSLKGISVAEFYKKVFEVLNEFGIYVKINPVNVEMPKKILLDCDNQNKSYDENAVIKWHQILISTGKVFERFKSGFWGKQSPVNFFWGSFDLAQVRFSGKYVEAPSGSDLIYRVAMDAEQSAVGFWPGDDKDPEPLYFAYTYPKPPGIDKIKLKPDAAYWSNERAEFFLRYHDVRESSDPASELLKFCQSAYVAGADLAGWDRKNLERKLPFSR